MKYTEQEWEEITKQVRSNLRVSFELEGIKTTDSDYEKIIKASELLKDII